MSFDKQYIDKSSTYYGYDFSSYYAHLLSKFELQMPVKQGKPSKIKDLRKKLKYGIYNVKISCDNDDFKKIFSFSSNDCYTHYSLNFCLKYKKKFNISFELLQCDGDSPNCLIYEESDLVNTSKIFSDWFVKLYDIKKKLPKNKLVKHLLTNIWGCLIQFNRTIVKTDEELQNYDISDLKSNENTEYKLLEVDAFLEDGEIKHHYKISPSNCMYKRQFRIKPFLTSYARRQMAEFIIQENIINNIVRIQTDGIVLNKEFNFSHLPYHPIAEAKTTGEYIWYNLNSNSKSKE
jgi:hypothetical protein